MKILKFQRVDRVLAVLTKEIIRGIVNDFAPRVHGLKRVGLAGSYAREDFTDDSDVDLVFSLENSETDGTLTETVRELRSVFLNQFRKDLDVIKYDGIFKFLQSSINDFQRKGYEKMLEDLIWIWEDNA